MLKGLEELRGHFLEIRAVRLPNDVPPALQFRPAARPAPVQETSSARATPEAPPSVPPSLEQLAFAPLTQWSELVRRRQVRCEELARMYLERLKRLDPKLLCVITLTEERAMAQALELDRELERGLYRGPLHGIPWGAKDLLATRGVRTTFGAGPYRDQRIEEDATVVRRLDEAGAVLIAKLSLGELAWGDVWFGGQTRNPWNLEQGSSGSSAGPASATAAGCVGFAIGSETWGSIVSPSTRCGVTGLRPSFGRVSRHGAMALSWSMDKLGPLARSAQDCALVLQAIAGPDGRDETVGDAAFRYPPQKSPRELRVGYVPSLFEAKPQDAQQERWRANDQAVLEVLRAQGIELHAIELPTLPVKALSFILTVEAAAAFDELTRSGRDDELVRQVEQAWPNVFRLARTVPAVEYIQANRVRTLLMREMERILTDLDAYVVPSFGGENLLLTNLTGHPALCLPNGFLPDGAPTSITFQGRLFGEAELLALGTLYQDATDFHRQHPALPPG
jgi:Asp-tRNA(Asn)/Glu-tRNA(Gln) amidotransferase A subunit family amidase